MAKAENPFIALGFAPSAIEGLSNEHIRLLVKAQYRVLVTIHHPDRHGDPKKFQEAQEAFDKLEQDFEFDYWKKIFLRPRKDQIAEAEKTKKAVVSEAQKLHRSLVDFWTAFCVGRRVFGYESARLGKNTEELLGIKAFSVFDPPPVSVLMRDTFKSLVAEQHALKEGNRPPPEIGDTFEFSISPEGVMKRQNLVMTHFDPREPWRPSVRKEWINLSRTYSKSYYWKPEGEPVIIEGRLLGSISSKYFDDRDASDTSHELAGLLPTDLAPKDFEVVDVGYALPQFEAYLRFVKPLIEGSHWVIVLEGSSENTLRFKVIGYATRINDWSEEESEVKS